MMLTSRCLLFLCNFRSHSLLFCVPVPVCACVCMCACARVCVCVCGYQLSVHRVSRPRTERAPATHMLRSKLERPRREQRPSTAT